MNKHFVTLVYVVTALLLVASVTAVLLPWYDVFKNTPYSRDPADWGVFGDYVGGVLSTVISTFAFIGIVISIAIQRSVATQDKELRDDEIYNKQATECLNQALFLIDGGNNRLIHDRDSWLESARLILTAQQLAGYIKTDSMKKVYEVTERLIRAKFDAKLNEDSSPETRLMDFFSGTDWEAYINCRNPNALEGHSVYVIYSFMSWQNEEGDLLSLLRAKMSIEKVSRRYRVAREFLARFINSQNNS